METRLGTIGYMAPEIGKGEYNEKVIFIREEYVDAISILRDTIFPQILDFLTPLCHTSVIKVF